jgi:hypothetical protein
MKAYIYFLATTLQPECFVCFIWFYGALTQFTSNGDETGQMCFGYPRVLILKQHQE